MPLAQSLDPHTLLVCGHLLLVLMAAALLLARPLPGSRSRTLPLWIVSLLIYVLPGALLTVGDHPARALGPPLRHPPTSDGMAVVIQVFLIQSFAFQVMALREVTHGLRTRTRIVAVAMGALVLATGLPRLWPGLDVLALAHAAVPVIAYRALWVLATQGAGGAAAAAAIALGALPSWAALAGIGGVTDRGPTTFIILCDLLSLFGGSLGLLLWHQGNIQRLLEQVATSDALTGALNRHGFLPRLADELARARRRTRPVSVVACDLDHFKRVNDTLGHPVGDAVLAAFVARARAVLRSTDIVGRLGGEEFALVLPETRLHDAVQIMERMRAIRLPVADGVPQVTFSAGVATAGEGAVYDAEVLLKAADRRLYAAKAVRDRIVAHDAPDAAVDAVV